MNFAQRIERSWYQSAWKNAFLLPLWGLFALVAFSKRWLFLHRHKQPNTVPVVVVGNISVGGTGKTPLIIYLIERARELGFTPAVVSRGYGGKAAHYPLVLGERTDAAQAGDEPFLIYQRLRCTVVVDPNRARAVKKASALGATIIFSDDGLQHYAMNRDVEIAIVDGKRRFGNGWLLPIGPLRESISRLASVDLVLENGSDFQVDAQALIHTQDKQQQPLSWLSEQEINAVAGIGNPERFYHTLQSLGAKVTAHSFADHYAFRATDFASFDAQTPLVMTEKDWVKCQSFAQKHWWYLQVGAVVNPAVAVKLDALLLRCKQDR